ncbi:MAG: GTP-binding protein [Candidatus Heimdallarchaeota archaeon]|nr:GTP-binding protein [Candidatus Heimdallarchaeota archaeon]
MPFNLKSNKRKHKNLIICGLDSVGKTTLVNYMLLGEFTNTISTKKFDHSKIIFPNILLDIYDLGGNETFRSKWLKYNKIADGLIYVIDSTDIERIADNKIILYDILKTQIKSEIPILILLSKIDLDKRINAKQILNELQLFDINNKIQWAIFEISVILEKGIREAFQWLVNILENENSNGNK